MPMLRRLIAASALACGMAAAPGCGGDPAGARAASATSATTSTDVASPPPPSPAARPAASRNRAAAAREACVDDSMRAQQMTALLDVARASASGLPPRGRCYAAVARYIDTVGYGNMPAQPPEAIGSLPSIPDAYGAYAHQFADYVNDGHAAELGLEILDLDDPYLAPPGAIVVVRAGTPGTSHPTAGDISVAAGDGVFYNDGEMGYGGDDGFPPGNDFVLGIYAPIADACE